jgi:16S rRNA (guanine966-N2)-methyltransferase
MSKTRKRSSARPGGGPQGRFRIIGGEWRSRRFAGARSADVRPTPDRVRETVFNWLAPVIEGARCLDLYAGSGALGLEALSRGAALWCSWIARRRCCGRSRPAWRRSSCARGEMRVQGRDDLPRRARRRPSTSCSSTRLTARASLEPAWRLAEGGWLAEGARVYLEHEAGARAAAAAAGWSNCSAAPRPGRCATIWPAPSPHRQSTP